MKKTLIATLIMSSVAFAYADDHKDTSPATLDSKEQKLGYSLGTMLGTRMSQNFSDLDVKSFVAGFEDATADKELQMTMEEVTQTIQAYQQEEMEKAQLAQQKVAEEAKAASEAWLKEKEAEDSVQKTESGLLYKVITTGEGEKPAATDTVKVDYEGTLMDGSVFDSSYQRGEAITFPLNGVIPGWTEGLQLMPVGSKYELYIPADLAYGPGGTGPIPPNAALKFVVELHGIEKAE
ncbi:FKBP-type peptidyl-prolyl cis-trans isomerase [Marinomonas posidonica]|uniref:Peptidyl-prolyl cis-trans isomerase n=1 Tax=Marinomonas posidonica (strain CECT 7376 / NCIMB 14433 / IVIA-Po-181) TaxID=491952 RepID=F6CZR0_MARPP|nr:FKBP-type peptidyl-prolyl cis-trans isomerase [Marinomonas posidonica]AEF53571.1 peptidylprolyl isomerase FKBP-type [Marinomonas posidonica IVIA-Po-181]